MVSHSVNRIVVFLNFDPHISRRSIFLFDRSKDYLNRVAEGSGNVDPSGNFSIEGKTTSLYGCCLISFLFGAFYLCQSIVDDDDDDAVKAISISIYDIKCECECESNRIESISKHFPQTTVSSITLCFVSLYKLSVTGRSEKQV